MFEERSLLTRAVSTLAKAMAIAGGLTLVAIVVLIVVSVTGRALLWAGLRPITGDYELVSAGIGFAVFAFLPWTHLNRGHAVVTIFTDNFSPKANSILLFLADLAMLAASSFIAWRLYFGMLDKFAYRETTLLLRMPLGWSYAACMVGASIFVIVALFVFARTVEDIIKGNQPRLGQGAGH